MRLSHYHGKQNIIHVEETTAENVPFTVENRCSELVLKVKQCGESVVSVKGPHISVKYLPVLAGEPWHGPALHLG